jgi:hypothetical protein
MSKICVISCVGYRFCPKVQPFMTELKHSLPKIIEEIHLAGMSDEGLRWNCAS